jgi:outer membrane protein assembly factor BamB
MDYLYVGAHGFVSKLDPVDGRELWRRNLGMDLIGTRPVKVAVVMHDGRVFAGAGNTLFCLDDENGQILWQPKLKGAGLVDVHFFIGDKRV